MCISISQYPVINSEISVHFWDNISIITDEGGILSMYDNVKYEMNEQYTDILELCNGQNSVEMICDKISATYNKNSSANVKIYVKKMIENMYSENIIHFESTSNVQKKYWGKRGLTYPLYVSIELTNKCNFLCDFCYKNSNFVGANISSATVDNIYELIGGKTKNIQFTGGEPFLCDDIDKYITMFSDHNISVITNGSLLYKHDDSILKKISLFQISLYGSNEDEYDVNTCNKTGWHNIMLSIEKLNRLGCKYHLSVVLNKKNYTKIEDYICAAIKFNAKKIVFGTQTPVGRGINNKNSLTIDEFKIAYRLMRQSKHKYNKHIEIEEWSHKGYQNDSKNISATSIKSYQGLLGCGGGTSQFVISQNGKVRPCELLPESYFNLGGIEVIKRAIHGEYLNRSIVHHAKEFNNELQKHEKEFSQFCEPFDHLLKGDVNDNKT